MWTDVGSDAYGRFMGRYAEPLADLFVDLADLGPGQRALDVGCGPGALTTRLVDRLGASAVAAVDPSPPFVEVARERCPGVDVRSGRAEELPFEDGVFDVALAQLVVHFMADPVAGLREMGRVVVDGGRVGACVWDHAGGTGPLAAFWSVAHELDPDARDESGLAGSWDGHLAELCTQAGLRDAVPGSLTVTVAYDDAAAWWTPYTFGVGPAGQYVAGLSDTERDRLRDACLERLPAGPFEVSARAWTAVARVGDVAP